VEEWRSLENYVDGAGGFNYKGDKGEVSVKYANCEVGTRHRTVFGTKDPKPRPGVVVFVLIRDATQNTNYVTLVGGIAQTLASVLPVNFHHPTPMGARPVRGFLCRRDRTSAAVSVVPRDARDGAKARDEPVAGGGDGGFSTNRSPRVGAGPRSLSPTRGPHQHLGHSWAHGQRCTSVLR